MSRKKKLLYTYGSLIALSTLIVGVTFSVFTDKSQVLGATFTTGSVDLKFLSDLTVETNPTNYVDQLTGPNLAFHLGRSIHTQGNLGVTMRVAMWILTSEGGN